MNKFKTYCTEEQTRKALALGAPLEVCNYNEVNTDRCFFNKDTVSCYRKPTTEEMINWLEEQKEIEFTTISKSWDKWYFYINLFGDTLIGDKYQSRKEATLKAIDAALDYLAKTSM